MAGDLARGLSRFAGREATLESLNRAFDLARSGKGQLAAIVDEAGIGKSRLIHEFIQSIGASDWQVLAGSSVSYGKATTWLPVIDLLKDYLTSRRRTTRRECRKRSVPL